MNRDKTWAELFSNGTGYKRHEEVFWKLLKAHAASSEVALVDDCAECSGPMLGFLRRGIKPKEIIDGILQNCASGTHQLRAIRIDQLGEPDSWIDTARERRLQPTVVGNHLLLDFFWDKRGQAAPSGVHRISLKGPFE